MKRLAAPLATSSLFVAAVACSSGDHGNSLSGGFDPGNHGVPNGQSCVVPDVGCPCDSEGSLVECGEWVGKDPSSVPSCAKGFRRCTHGSWGACGTLTDNTPTPKSMGFAAPSATRGTCTTAKCDPNCVGDFTDNSIPDGGVVADGGTGDGTFGKRPNGPPPASIIGYLTGAGIPASDYGFYHELDPGDTATDPVTLTATLNPVDVYFLLNSTTAMKPIIHNLALSIASIVTKVNATIPNVAWGDGRFSNYLAWPYASQQFGNTVYENRVNLNTDSTQTVNDINFIDANSSTLLVDTPYVQAQAAIPALYAMATGEELGGWVDFSSGFAADWWWNVFSYYGSDPWAFQLSPFVAKAPGCGGGGVGYPCFRSGAYHLVMLMMDFPSMSGPGGSFPYYQFKPRYFPPNASADYTTSNDWYWWYSGSLGGPAPTLPTDFAGSQSVTITKAAGAPQVYIGNVMGRASNWKIGNANAVGPGGVSYPYSASAIMKCQFGDASYHGTGPDAEYNFTLPAGVSSRFWFDVVGSSYDTVLYLVNTDTNQIVACGDDEFGWLSAEDISRSGVNDEIRNIGKTNSGIVGDIPPGHYKLVVDNYGNTFPDAGSMSNRGSYQLQMWPIIDDPRYGGNPHGTDINTPSYNQALNALKAPSLKAYVMGLEASGYDCGQTVTSWERVFTRWSLEKIATDTNAVTGSGPVVISVKQDGSPGPASGSGTAKCPTASSFGDLVASKIAEMTNNLAQPVTVSAIDFDDMTDFDGTTGVNAGPTVLTPFNVDDATFVSKIVANPVVGCTVNATGDGYSSCGPGTNPKFSITFAVPGTVPKRANPQIFHFRLDMKSGSTVTATQMVTLVVPPYAWPPVDYVRDFDGSSCPKGYIVQWKNYHWTSSTPSDSYVSFFVTAADTAAGLDSATEDTPAFGLARANPGPDTQIGAADLGAYLTAQTPNQSKKPFLRVRAHLEPSSDKSVGPKLTSWYLEMDCAPNE